MALLMFEGFERRETPPVHLGDSIAEVEVSGANGVTWQTGRVSGYAIQLISFSSLNPSRMAVNFPSASGIAFGFALAPATGGVVMNMLNTDVRFIRIGETGANVMHLALRFNVANKIELIRGDGTILATTANVVSKTGWVHYAMEAVIADGTGGSCKVWVNGVQVINVSGVDTRNGGTGTVNQMLTGSIATATAMTSPGSAGDNGVQYDDLWVCDLTGSAPYNGSLGNCIVETIVPSAQGPDNGWVGSDGNSTDNWALIDELPASTTDYIGSGTSAARDTSAMLDVAGTSMPVLAIRTETQLWASDGGVVPADVKELVRDASGNEVTAVIATVAQVATTAKWAKGPVRTLTPTNGALSEAAVNGLRVGVALS